MILLDTHAIAERMKARQAFSLIAGRHRRLPYPQPSSTLAEGWRNKLSGEACNNEVGYCQPAPARIAPGFPRRSNTETAPHPVCTVRGFIE